MAIDLVTFAEVSTVKAEVIAAVVRTKLRVAAQSSAFCGDQSTTVWYPVAPGVTPPAAPTPTTNANPAPPNSVALPVDFDPTDTCYLFQDLLPLSTAPVYAEELNPTIILEPYNEIVPLLGITVASLLIREYPYELTLPSESIAAVTRSAIQVSSYLLSAACGTFTATGQTAALKQNRNFIGTAGTFSLVGAASSLVRNYYLAATAGSYALAGQAASLTYQRLPFAAESGTFVLEGQDIQLLLAKPLFAEATNFAVTGQDAGLSRLDAKVTADVGAFTISAENANLSIPVPTVIGSSINSNATADTSHVLTKPTTATGDLMIAVLMWRSNKGTLTAPSGWSLQGTYTSSIVISGTDQQNLLVYTKTATASEPSSYTWSATVSTRNCGLIVSTRNGVIDIVTENYGNNTTATISTVANRLNITAFTWIFAASSGSETYSQSAASGTLTQVTDSPNSQARISGGYITSATTVTSTHAAVDSTLNPNHGGINIQLVWAP